MKKILGIALLSAAALGLAARPAGAWCGPCCCKSCYSFPCCQYNAFSPCCVPNLGCLFGCCPGPYGPGGPGACGYGGGGYNGCGMGAPYGPGACGFGGFGGPMPPTPFGGFMPPLAIPGPPPLGFGADKESCQRPQDHWWHELFHKHGGHQGHGEGSEVAPCCSAPEGSGGCSSRLTPHADGLDGFPGQGGCGSPECSSPAPSWPGETAPATPKAPAAPVKPKVTTSSMAPASAPALDLSTPVLPRAATSDGKGKLREPLPSAPTAE